MNRLFCWLLLAAILVQKGELKFGLEVFGLWVASHPLHPNMATIHVSDLFTNIPLCLYANVCAGSILLWEIVLVSKQLIVISVE